MGVNTLPKKHIICIQMDIGSNPIFVASFISPDCCTSENLIWCTSKFGAITPNLKLNEN